MAFDISKTGAAITVVLRTSATAPLLRSGLCGQLDAALPAYARDPEVYAMLLRPQFQSMSDAPSAQPSFAELVAGARLAWRLECFSKPTVSLIDGPIQGYLAGLVMAGTHRAAGEGYRFKVEPDDLTTAADGGLLHWLAHLNSSVGAYLLATGRMIGPADAYRFGLVTHVVPAARFGEIESGLGDADPVDPLLDDRHVPPPVSPDNIAMDRLIAECFADPDLAGIRQRLGSHPARDLSGAAIADVERTAAGGRLGDALAWLAKAAKCDMRATLMDGLAALAAAGEKIDLPTRSEHQALRNR